MSNVNASNWAIAKRVFHWGLAIAVLVALIAPKPDDGGGLLHISAGLSALALVLVRVGWRLAGDVRPHVAGSWRLKAPDVSNGLRGLAPPLAQGARLGGFLFLALIPVAVSLALAGIGAGEDSQLLEAHEAAGKAIMALAIAHAAAIVLFTVIMRYDILRVTLTGGARSVFEGGARGVLGLAVGAAAGAIALVYVFGPFEVAAKASMLNDHAAAETDERGDDD